MNRSQGFRDSTAIARVLASLVVVAALGLAACAGSGGTTTTASASATTSASVGVGPQTGPAGSFAITTLTMDPRDPSILYAGTAAGLFKTTDGARSWRRLATPRGQRDFVSVDPASPATVYSIYDAEGADPAFRLQRSLDGGATQLDLSAAGAPRINGYMIFVWFDTSSTPSAVSLQGTRGGDIGDLMYSGRPTAARPGQGSANRTRPGRPPRLPDTNRPP